MAKSTKRGFSSTLESYEQIMEQLIKGNYAPVYFLCGDEPFFIDKISNYISLNALEEEHKSFNQFLLFGSEVTATDISDVSRQYPMIATRNVVIVREAQAIKSFDALLSYINTPLESTVLVLCYSGTINKTQKLYKAITKQGVYFESISPRDYEIHKWLSSYIRSKGYTADAVSVTLLVESLGTSITRLDNEIEKLFNAIPLDRKTITLNDIEQNIGISKEFNNFELTRALSERNLFKAIQIADHFGKNPLKNSFQSTVIAIFNHYNRIFKLGLLQWESQTKRTMMPNDQQLALSLGIGSTFFLGEYRQALANYPLKKIFVIFEIIREYEMKGKGIDSGSASSGELLKELIFKIISI